MQSGGKQRWWSRSSYRFCGAVRHPLMSYSNRLWAAGSSLEPLSHTASDLPEPATRKPETTCAPVLGDSSLAGLIGYAQSCSYAFECLGPRSRCGSVGSKGLVFS